MNSHDPLSVAANIAGLLALTLQTTGVVEPILADAKNRPTEILKIGQEISSFYLVLSHLEGQLQISSADGRASQNGGLDVVLGDWMPTLRPIMGQLAQI